MFDKIKTTAKNAGKKVANGVKANKAKIIKGVAIAGGAAVSIGAVALSKKFGKDRYIPIEDESVDIYEYQDPETGEVIASAVIDAGYEKPEFELVKKETDEGEETEEKED